MLFNVCLKSLHLGDWSEVEAESPTEAAEKHVEELCLYDAELYGVFCGSGEVVTVAHGDAECEVRVVVDMEPTFWSEVVE